MVHTLIATSFLIVAVVLLWTAYQTPEFRSITLGAGVLTAILGGYAAWLAWSIPPTSTPETRGQRLITIHGFGEPPPVSQRSVMGNETPEEMVAIMGCGVCHQIPGVEAVQSGLEGPLLIPAVTAPKRLASAAYRHAVEEGRAAARTPREYVVESILNPSAFIVPGFEQRGTPSESTMPNHFGTAFTVAALETLADYLLTRDCEAAARDRLTGPRVEPIESLCGTRPE
jgi:hypothetical protein